MLTATIGEVLGDIAPAAQANNCVYVIRQGDICLYVGKTTRRPLNARLRAHLGEGPKFMAQSAFGAYIAEHQPTSYAWTIAIFTREDWNATFDSAGLPRRFKLNTAEAALIRMYRPLLNRTSHPDHIRPTAWDKRNHR